MNVANLRAALDGGTLFTSCTLTATARDSGLTIEQPFAEVLKIEDGLVIEGTPFHYDTASSCAALGHQPSIAACAQLTRRDWPSAISSSARRSTASLSSGNS